MLSPNALYAVTEIRAIEQAALAALPAFTLMQRAGNAACKHALEILGDRAHAAHILVLAGPGNNGGDALQAACGLGNAGAKVTALLFAEAGKQSSDAMQALERAKSSTVQFADPAGFGPLLASKQWTLVIDGLFGIGLARAISGPLRKMVETINALSCPVLALDVPSGLDADTGNIIGEQGVAVRASHTITFIANKPGLHTCFGRDYAGAVKVASLDIETRHVTPARAQLNAPEAFCASLRRRAHNSHKGSYGDVVIVGGAQGMGGAAILAARAAAKCGAGRVFAAFVTDPPRYDGDLPELMCRLADEVNFSDRTLVVGPGLGATQTALHLVRKALAADAPLVLDADALNLIAAEPDLQQRLAGRRSPALLTPHPLEAARLFGSTAAQVQADRPAAARALAARFNAITILKGSGSVIANPNGEIAINPTGNAALATAGTGDVLAGMCGALLAQGWLAWHAALGATWLHGQAADILVGQGIGPIGLTASELVPCARTLLNRLMESHAQIRAAS